MVLSQINTQTDYKERRAVDTEDVGHSAAVYEIDAFGSPIIITLGKPKFTFSAKHIIFYPIYAINKKGRVEAQIGVFEITQERALKVLDEENDPDVDKLGAPLFYAFSEKLLKEMAYPVEEYLHDWAKPPASVGGSGKDESSIERKNVPNDEPLDPLSVGVQSKKASPETEAMRSTLSSGVFEVAPEPVGLPMLIEETDMTANAVKKDYRTSSSHCWLQGYMKNGQYAIHDVEPGGDSLFAVVRDAFSQGGRRTTVAKLRALVATEIDDSTFHQRRREFLDLDGAAKRGMADLKRIKDVSSPGLKRRATAAQKTKSQDELSRIVSEGTTLKNHFQALTASVKDLEHQMKIIGVSEMATADSLDAFRALVQTASYPADSFSIETLERKLGAKIVVLSENAYSHGDLTCVVECGTYRDGGDTDASVPKHYILAVRKGGHYRLVSYKTKKLLAFSELPYHIKVLIVNKCLEENAGDFWGIQDFRNLKTRLEISADAGRRPVADMADESRGLCDSDSVLMFHAKSCKTPLPGMGQGESRLPRHALEFSELGGKACEGWRRVLDDDWTGAPFVVEGRKYMSVEHYFQGAKFRAGFPDFSLRFSTAPDSDDAKEGETKMDVAAAKALGSEDPPKRGAKSSRPENIVVDPEFYPIESKKARLEALRAKFGQNQDAKNILLLTRDSELTRYYVNRPAERDVALMTVRRELSA